MLTSVLDARVILLLPFSQNKESYARAAPPTSENHVKMSSNQLQLVNFKEYQAISDSHKNSAAVVIPGNFRTIATSGHVGIGLDGKLVEDLESQMRVSFKVSCLFSCLNNHKCDRKLTASRMLNCRY